MPKTLAYARGSYSMHITHWSIGGFGAWLMLVVYAVVLTITHWSIGGLGAWLVLVVTHWSVRCVAGAGGVCCRADYHPLVMMLAIYPDRLV